MAKKATLQSWTLEVTVLRAEDILTPDYFSEADCYVTVCLPSTYARVRKTKVVENCSNPEWNHTFTFNVNGTLQKNLLISLYDEDDFKYDNLMHALSFDISSLTPGTKETKEFFIDPQGKLWIDFELREREKRVINPLQLASEAVCYQTLSVTVLEARLRQSADFFSESDCYVVLSLPTASARTNQTRMVSNSSNPRWNETFCFRIPTSVKNVLEVKLYDNDTALSDDLISTLLFDVNTLTMGQRETKVFPINDQDHIVMEFELLQSPDPPCEYLSNGILMAAPFSALDVHVDELHSSSAIDCKVMTLNGSYELKQLLPSKNKPKLRFHVNRDLETELSVAPRDAVDPEMEISTKLDPLAAQYAGKVPLVVNQDKVDLGVETNNSEEERLAVRLDFDIPEEEKEFLKKRRSVVAKTLQELLGLESLPTSRQVPTIAVVGSGGGTRAMTGLFGSLKGLRDIGLLDAVTYITGVSGSTWAMSALYQDTNWSAQAVDRVIAAVKNEVKSAALGMFSPDRMEYYSQEMSVKRSEGYAVSSIDMFGLLVERQIFGKMMTSTLSDQQTTVNEGQNPLPIYTAVNMRSKMTCSGYDAEWCEFTPYEVGFPKYGAFVRSEDFGSEFFLGHLIKKLPELRIPYLLGIWSSAISVSLNQLWTLVAGSEPPWSSWLGTDVTSVEADTDVPSSSSSPAAVAKTQDAGSTSYWSKFTKSCFGIIGYIRGTNSDNKQPGSPKAPKAVDTQQSDADTYVIDPDSTLSGTMTRFLKNRPLVAEVYNFMRGLFLRADYSKNNNFTAWKDNHPDAFPNNLTPNASSLFLIDSGHAINIGCVPILRPERDVDLVIVMSYSMQPQYFWEVLKKTIAYCKDHNIPFPDPDFARLETEPKKEIYIFEDKENPKAPTVIHFSLVNDTHRYFKQPGVKRETAEELEAAEMDVTSNFSPYCTRNFSYTEKDFQALVDLSAYNVCNNKESILQTVRNVVAKKKANAQK